MNDKSVSIRKSWLVVGGGPCGIGVVGMLLDCGQEVTWVDPAFEVGRMGKFYRNVPANTLNGDLMKAFGQCDSFEFPATQLERLQRGNFVMSDLPFDTCHNLAILVDALQDTSDVLKRKVHHLVYGYMESIKLMEDGRWEYFILSKYHGHLRNLVDAVVLVNGCHPRCLPQFPLVQESSPSLSVAVTSSIKGESKIVKFHSLDLLLDPIYTQELLRSNEECLNQRWAVIGNSHSGMLVVKNLLEAGHKDIVNLHRSPMKFMHKNERGVVKNPGTGLKGPVGEWVKEYYNSNPAIKCICVIGDEWESTLVQQNIDHCVVAIGFDREDNIKIETHDGHLIGSCYLDEYDGISGEVKFGDRSIRLFGTGIAFPKFHYDEEGDFDPWVGFRKSIEQTVLMVQAVCLQKP